MLTKKLSQSKTEEFLSPTPRGLGAAQIAVKVFLKRGIGRCGRS